MFTYIYYRENHGETMEQLEMNEQNWPPFRCCSSSAGADQTPSLQGLPQAGPQDLLGLSDSSVFLDLVLWYAIMWLKQ